MFRKIKNIFLYAGVDKTSYDRVKSRIQKVNLTMTTTLSAFATILISAMILISFFSDGLMQNRSIYILGVAMSLVILILSVTIAKKHTELVYFLIYLSDSIYYLYGILIGAITDPNGKTVTFMVMLVFMPILFIDRPFNILSTTSIYVIIFSILCYYNKKGPVLSVDIIDAIIFGLLGTVSGAVVNHMKVRGYTFEQKLQEISRIDQLTQVRNRNAFEFERDSIQNFCKHSLAVIYIDVNGLHEVNNENGHEFGDAMLKYIASEVKYSFSEKYTYRIGGDEFIAFMPDKTNEEIEKSVQEMVKKIEMENYHIAVGYEIAKIRHFSIDNLINTAEKKMINDKKLYYKNIATRETRHKNI